MPVKKHSVERIRWELTGESIFCSALVDYTASILLIIDAARILLATASLSHLPHLLHGTVVEARSLGSFLHACHVDELRDLGRLNTVIQSESAHATGLLPLLQSQSLSSFLFDLVSKQLC